MLTMGKIYADELNSIVTRLRECHNRKETEITISISQGAYNALVQKQNRYLYRAMLLAEYQPKFSECFFLSGRLTIKGMDFCTVLVFRAKNTDDMRRIFLSVQREQLSSFCIILLRSLADIIEADDFKELRLLEQDMYLFGCERIYRSGILEYHMFSVSEKHSRKNSTAAYLYGNGSRKLPYCSSLHEVIRHMSTMVRSCAKEISFFCTPEVYGELLQGGITLQSGELMKRYSSLVYNAGIMHSDDAMWEWNHRVSLDNIQYYPGLEVSLAVKKQQTDRLSARELKLFSAARTLIAPVQGKGPAEKALLISHEIGKRTEYVIDDNTDDDDCAYGPLLNGRANCDGYADAFYLCATLAGLKVRYQYGASNKVDSSGKDGLHMWNLVRINNQWLSMDATWDHHGNKEGMEWKHCLIGMDRAEIIYRWNQDMSPVLAQETNLHRAEGIVEYRCTSGEEAVRALSSVVKRKVAQVYLFMTRPDIISNTDKLFECMERIRGYKKYTVAKIDEFQAWKVMFYY